MTRALRIVVFSPSIISDIGNPQATTVRAMCQAFAESGHDVTHLEERGNDYLHRMLTLRGYAPMRAFNECYPLIRYRQFTIPRGMERSIWFGREIATADVIVGYPGIPPEIQHEITAFDIARRIRFSPESSDETVPLLPVWFDPAVLPKTAAVAREEAIAVAYDNIFDSDGIQEKYSLGAIDNPGWAAQPEILMPEIYSRAHLVKMSAIQTDPMERVRVLVPVAHGATVELVAPNGSITETVTTLPDQNNAQLRTRTLTTQIHELLSHRSNL